MKHGAMAAILGVFVVVGQLGVIGSREQLGGETAHRESPVAHRPAQFGQTMGPRPQGSQARPTSGQTVGTDAAVRIGNNLNPPTKVRDVQPVYPAAALDAKVSGVVILELRIDVDGMVENVRVLRSIPLLDQAAIDAASQWQYVPTLISGKPVPVIMTATVNFTLQPPAGSPKATSGQSQTAVNPQKKEADAAFGRGLKLELAGKIDEALEEYKLAVSLNPTDSTAWYAVGRHSIGRDNAAAVAALQKSLELGAGKRSESGEYVIRQLLAKAQAALGTSAPASAPALLGPGASGAAAPDPVMPPRAGAGAVTNTGRALPSYGRCNAAPNYLRENINLERWAGSPNGERIRINVSVSIDPSLPGLSRTAAARYLSGATAGARAWATAMFQHTQVAIFDINVTNDPSSAQIQIVLTDDASTMDDMAEGQADKTRGAVNGHPVVTGTRIRLFRGGRGTLKTLERFLANGTYSEWQFEAKIGELVAHEMGHALGINGHSSNPDDVMSEGGEPILDYTKWISQADANTLMHAYCGQGVGTTPTTRTTPASRPVERAPGVYAPFEGMWSCQVGPEGYDSFQIDSDGSVWPHEGTKAVVSAGGIRFEEAGDGSFYDKRIFEFRLVAGQLRGTRTETGGRFGSRTSVDNYTCTRDRQ